MKTNRIKDPHLSRLTHELVNINAINEWRNEAIKHAMNPQQRQAVEDRVFQLREAAAKGGAR